MSKVWNKIFSKPCPLITICQAKYWYPLLQDSHFNGDAKEITWQDWERDHCLSGSSEWSECIFFKRDRYNGVEK